MATKHVIWESNIDLEVFKEEFEKMGYTEEMGYTIDEQYQIACDWTNDALQDEKDNLDIELDNNIVVIADLGLWNGRRRGYKVIGTNLNDTLRSFMDCMTEIEFYTDGYNYCATEYHHDGTNHYIFRVLKDGVDVDKLGNYKDIMKYTKSLKKTVNNVYGW